MITERQHSLSMGNMVPSIKIFFGPGVVVHTHNPSIQEAETGGLQVQG
jgi:hypothetical protein